MGGGGFMADRASSLDGFMLSLSEAERPRVCLLPTPAGDSDRVIAAFFEAFAARDCEPSCVRLFGIPDRPVERLASQDVIYVSGGNTANALAVWRLHGVDVALREAWEGGAVLGGVSAGANCWFDACVTDSFDLELGRLDDGLGVVAWQLLPALRRRGAAPARLSRARRCRVRAGLCSRRRRGVPLRRHRATRGRRLARRSERLPRRARLGDADGRSPSVTKVAMVTSASASLRSQAEIDAFLRSVVPAP